MLYCSVIYNLHKLKLTAVQWLQFIYLQLQCDDTAIIYCVLNSCTIKQYQ